jgi:hypothetical protein
MATSEFVVKRVGGRYVAVPQQPTTGFPCAAWGAAGLVTTLYGLKRGGIGGILFTAAGGAALYRALTGRNLFGGLLCCPKRALDGDPHETPSFQHDASAPGVSQLPADNVDEAVMESFPASDAPAHTVSTGP